MLPDRAVAAQYSDANRNRDFLRSRGWRCGEGLIR